MSRILVVEDERDISELLCNYLDESGYQTEIAEDGVEAVSMASRQCYDLILLDVMLPKIDGFSVLEVIRKESAVPVIMLTALDDEDWQIKGYDLQVDDYVTKPFSMQVLLRKIAAVLRRTGGIHTEQEDILHYKELRVDLKGYDAWMGNRSLELTAKEFELLREFLLHQGCVLTRGQLLDRVWGTDYFGEERIVDTHIKNLRKKLQTDYIETIRGVGYRIDKIR